MTVCAKLYPNYNGAPLFCKCRILKNMDNTDIISFPIFSKTKSTLAFLLLAAISYGTVPTPFRVRSQFHGFSPELKKCPPDTFLRRLWRRRPLQIPPLPKQKSTLTGAFLFWRRRWDLNPRTVLPAYEISSHASSTT